MPVSPKIARHIWGEFAARCSICKGKKLIEPTPHSKTGSASLTGEIVHIVGEKPTSPRGNHPMPLRERNMPLNLMLLCQRHHKKVDDAPEHYTVKMLNRVRVEYLAWIDQKLTRGSPWQSNIAQLTYINVPRLALLASDLGQRLGIPELADGKTLHSLGWELNRVMLAVEETLSSIHPKAIPLHKIEGPYPAYIGKLCSFKDRFRTRNIRMPYGDKARPTIFTGDWGKDPNVYILKANYDLRMAIDPRWITTTTAFCLYRPSGGQSTFAGLCVITNVDPVTKLITATPLVMGIPQPPPEVQALYDAVSRRSIG
jgi:hypothetical protein